MKYFLSILFFSLITASFGQSSQKDFKAVDLTGMENNPCFKEAQSLCKHSDGPDCFKKNKHKLSSSCQKMFSKSASTGDSILKHCAQAFNKHCPIDLKAAEQDPMAVVSTQQKCIKKKMKKLPAKCQEYISGKRPGASVQIIK
jgi:hypothetical protein